MPFKWRLRMLMAQKGLWTGAELQRLLEEKTGVRISAPGISRLLNEEQVEIKLKVLDALCTVLECNPEDLILNEKSIGNMDQKKLIK